MKSCCHLFIRGNTFSRPVSSSLLDISLNDVIDDDGGGGIGSPDILLIFDQFFRAKKEHAQFVFHSIFVAKVHALPQNMHMNSGPM